MTAFKFDPKLFAVALGISFVWVLLQFDFSCNPQAPELHTGYKYDSAARSTITQIGDTGHNAIRLADVDTVYLPKWLSKLAHDTVLQIVDSNAIINMFLNNAYRYEQTIRDSDMVIHIEDTIFRNTPVWRKVTAKNLRATRFDTIIYVTPNTWHVFAGGEVGINTPDPQFRIGGIFQTKRGNQYSLHYNIFQPAPNIAVGVHFKIK